MDRNFNFKSPIYQPYAKALGQAALVWNDLHIVLSGIFAAATRIPNHMASDAMWNALKSDRAQRDMLEDVIGMNAINYNIPKDLRAEIMWVLERTNALEELRNNLIHSPIFSEGEKTIVAWHHLGNKRAKKLEGKDLIAEARWFYESVSLVRRHASLLNVLLLKVQRGSRAEIPRRPSLPNRGSLRKR